MAHIVTKSRKKLLRSDKDRIVAGVLGGLAEYFEIDSTVVRIVFVLLAFASFGFAILLYIIMALITPLDSQ